MAESTSGSPVIANRYQLEPLDDDWDTGRAGFTHPAIDLETGRKVVIKRVDITSPQSKQQEHNLQNEAEALIKLKGLGVPELYAYEKADYGSQQFSYLVIEFIDATRVEKEVSSLRPIERAQIIYELFRLLTKSHKRGIANGDVDIKHLFWLKKEKKLKVIDWGNATNVTSSQRNYHFYFDIARSAEIIYALVVQDGIVPVTGSLALLKKEKLVQELLPLPDIFYELCKWAPRNPSEEMSFQYNSLDLFDATQKWLSNLDPGGVYFDPELDKLPKTHHSSPHSNRLRFVILGGILTILVAAAIIMFSVFSPRVVSTPTPISYTSEIVQDTLLPTEVSPLQPIKATPSVLPIVPTETSTSRAISLLPKQYTKLFGVDTNLSADTSCWIINTDKGSLSKRENSKENKNWQLQTNKGNQLSDSLIVDFTNCLDANTTSAIGLNFWLERINPSSELGIYIQSENSATREYILRTDLADSTLHLTIRDENGIQTDYTELIIKPDLEGTMLSPFYKYSAKLFLELNNQGQDIIYLAKGSDLKPLTADNMSTNLDQMKKVDTRPSLDSIRGVGLIGHGPDIKAYIWPLVLYRDAPQ